MIYLAQPYSSPDPFLRHARYAAALATIAATDQPIYSPIVHWHKAAVRYNLCKDASFWWARNMHMLDLCSEVWVLTIEGWRQSIGLAQEVSYALALGKPVFKVTQHGHADFDSIPLLSIIPCDKTIITQLDAGGTYGEDNTERATHPRVPGGVEPG